MHERAPTPTTKTTTIVWICATWVAADRKRAPEMMTQGYNDTNGQQKGRTQDGRKEGSQQQQHSSVRTTKTTTA